MDKQLTVSDELRLVRSLMDTTLLMIELSDKYESNKQVKLLVDEWMESPHAVFFAKRLLNIEWDNE